MNINEMISSIHETLKYLLPSLSIVYKPVGYIKKSIKLKPSEIVSNVMVYGIISAIAILLMSAMFSNVFKIDLIPIISGRILLFSVIFVPTSLFIIIYEEVRFKQKAIVSVYLSVTFVCFYIIPIAFLFIIFLFTENYVFYYGYILLTILINWLYVIIMPLLIHKAKKRILGLLLTVLVFISSNFIAFGVISLINSKTLSNNSLDPIYIEFEENNLLSSAKYEYLDNIYEAIKPMIGRIPTEIEINQLLNQIESLENLDLQLNTLLNKLKFNTNKAFISNSLKRISEIKQIQIQLRRLKYVPDSVSKSIEEQEERLRLLIESTNQIRTIINRLYDNAIDPAVNISQSDYTTLKSLLGLSEDEEFSKESISIFLIKTKEIKDEIQVISEQVNQVGINKSALQEIVNIMSEMNNTITDMNKHLEYWNGILRIKNKFPILG